MRLSAIHRETKETQIQLALALDGTGKADIDTGCGFLDHMLELFARHGDFDLTVNCHGDIRVDYHHTAEDIGICLGKAFEEALGDKRGIFRYGQFLLPMDETLVLCAAKVGDFDTELAQEFWLGFVRNCPSTIHVRMLAGENTHHILEAVFKGLGRTLKAAVALDPRHAGEIPSTKGVL